MKIKINVKSDSCNCQGSTDSGRTNERKGEAPIHKRYSLAGMVLLIGAATMFSFHSFLSKYMSDWLRTNWLNWAQAAEVYGIMFFGVAMARWRG